MSELKAGLRWARHLTGTSGRDWTRWVVVLISGKAPFLTAAKVFDPGSSYGVEVYASFTMEPEKWQFGPELNIPDRNYIEIIPDTRKEDKDGRR